MDCPAGQGCRPSDKVCAETCTSSADCEDGQFCSSLNFCEGECGTCGGSCETTTECPAGQYCTAGSCQQECTPGQASARECDGRACREDGKCADKSDIDIGGGGMGGGDGDGDNVDCIDVEVAFEPQIPNVVLLIDQSGSMNAGSNFDDAVNEAIMAGTYTPWDCDEGDQDWRWNVVRNVLLNPDSGVVKPLEDDVRFGLALYSSENGNIGGTCPILTEVDLAFGNHAAMLEAFECSDILSDTPTRESLTATAEELAGMDVEGPKVIVLATDGEPDTCECANWDDNNGRPAVCDENGAAAAERDLVVEEALRIHEELGITVEVINVSNPDNTALADHLDDVAEAGGAVSSASIDGFSPGELGSAFQSIIDGVRSCAIDLDGMIESGKESTGTVTLDGEKLVLDDPDGWQVNTPTQIELLGEACETIKSGDHDLDISFPCGAFRPPVLK